MIKLEATAKMSLGGSAAGLRATRPRVRGPPGATFDPAVYKGISHPLATVMVITLYVTA